MNASHIINSFKQGKRGNCVSIAVIKAAMFQYGIDNVFNTLNEIEGDKLEIEMRDGFKTVIRPHEIAKASKYSRFNKGVDEIIRKKAYIYYTAMAKRVLVEGEIDAFLGRRTLRGALRSLHNGENYMEGIKWLGLVNNFEAINKNEVRNHRSLVGASSGHCYFISEGMVDNYGKEQDYDEVRNRSAFKTKHLLKII